MIIDTHCHLNHEKFADDADGAVDRALAAGVTAMVVVGYDLPSSEKAVELAAARPETLFAVVGVHPHDARLWSADFERRLCDLASSPGVVAIGEIGLDYHYDFSPRDDQHRAFAAQLELAARLDLPVVIHCRDAYDDTLQLLAAAAHRPPGGVMHCWAGAVDAALATVELGYHLGFGGTLTFKSAQTVRQSLEAVPLERIVLETDAPYLAPVPHRGRRNEPAYTRIVAEHVAELKGLSLEEVAKVTTGNALRLFSRMRQ